MPTLSVHRLLPTLQQRSPVSNPKPTKGTLFFDGGAKPNPGFAGAGFVLQDDRGI